MWPGKLYQLKNLLKPWVLKTSGPAILPMVARVTQPLAANGVMAHGTNPGGIKILKYMIGLRVITTNNGSNYWTVHLQKVDGTSYTLVGSVNTSALSAGTWATVETTLNHSVDSAVDLLYIECQTTGSPGSLYWGHPIVIYQFE